MITLPFPYCPICGRRLTCIGTSRRYRMCSNACRRVSSVAKH